MAVSIHPLLLAALLLTGAAASTAAAGGPAAKVDVGFYYESLCLGCAGFVVQNLAGIFADDGLLAISNVTFVPYGNAEADDDGTIHCQHGPDECLLNTVEACAIDTWPDTKDHFRFIHCVESVVKYKNHSEWESCFDKLGVDPKHVTDCYKSERGHQLQLKYKDLTEALDPPHDFVPWVVVAGNPLKMHADNVVSYICKAYKGPLPKACKKAGLERRHPIRKGDGVSYKSGAVKPAN